MASWLYSAIMLIITAILIYFVVQGVLFIGWAIGGVIGLILAILVAMEILENGGFFGALVGLIILCLIIDWIF